MSHQWSIRCHHDNISVSLETGHEGSFCNRGLPVISVDISRHSSGLGSILTCEDFRSRPVVTVIAPRIREEPLGTHIVVFVDDVRLKCAPRGPQAVEWLSRRQRSGANDHLDFRMLGFQRSRKHMVALEVTRAPLLVAYAEHREMERPRVPHLSP